MVAISHSIGITTHSTYLPFVIIATKILFRNVKPKKESPTGEKKKINEIYDYIGNRSFARANSLR